MWRCVEMLFLLRDGTSRRGGGVCTWSNYRVFYVCTVGWSPGQQPTVTMAVALKNVRRRRCEPREVPHPRGAAQYRPHTRHKQTPHEDRTHGPCTTPPRTAESSR